jgi:hypothetical protein
MVKAVINYSGVLSCSSVSEIQSCGCCELFYMLCSHRSSNKLAFEDVKNLKRMISLLFEWLLMCQFSYHRFLYFVIESEFLVCFKTQFTMKASWFASARLSDDLNVWISWIEKFLIIPRLSCRANLQFISNHCDSLFESFCTVNLRSLWD